MVTLDSVTSWIVFLPSRELNIRREENEHIGLFVSAMQGTEVWVNSTTRVINFEDATKNKSYSKMASLHILRTLT